MAIVELEIPPIVVDLHALLPKARLALTVKETAETIGREERWVRDKINEGVIPHARIGGSILIPVEALNKWLNDAVKATQAE